MKLSGDKPQNQEERELNNETACRRRKGVTQQLWRATPSETATRSPSTGTRDARGEFLTLNS
jgi:hypothetical protein